MVFSPTILCLWITKFKVAHTWLRKCQCWRRVFLLAASSLFLRSLCLLRWSFCTSGLCPLPCSLAVLRWLSAPSRLPVSNLYDSFLHSIPLFFSDHFLVSFWYQFKYWPQTSLGSLCLLLLPLRKDSLYKGFYWPLRSNNKNGAHLNLNV